MLLSLSARSADENPDRVEVGNKVSIEYTLTLDDGSTVDSTVGQAVVYRHGASQILAGLESELTGLTLNETKQFTLPPERGYGLVNPQLREEVETSMIPEESRKAGAQIVSSDPQGNTTLIRVHEVKGDKIVLDLNHPLAGQTLHFDVKVIGIE